MANKKVHRGSMSWSEGYYGGLRGGTYGAASKGRSLSREEIKAYARAQGQKISTEVRAKAQAKGAWRKRRKPAPISGGRLLG